MTPEAKAILRALMIRVEADVAKAIDEHGDVQATVTIDARGGLPRPRFKFTPTRTVEVEVSATT